MDTDEVISNVPSSIDIISKEDELNMALIEMEISDEDEVDSEIKRLIKKRKRFTITNPKRASELAADLEKCRKIKRLFDEINRQMTTTTISQQSLSKNEEGKTAASETNIVKISECLDTLKNQYLRNNRVSYISTSSASRTILLMSGRRSMYPTLSSGRRALVPTLSPVGRHFSRSSSPSRCHQGRHAGASSRGSRRSTLEVGPEFRTWRVCTGVGGATPCRKL